MKHIVLPIIVLVACQAYAADKTARCELMEKSVISRSSSGLAQVSNVGTIEIICHVAVRAFPVQPGQIRSTLRITTNAYQVSADGREKLVPSEVNLTGGGFSPDSEFADFLLHLPLDRAERQSEAERLITKMQALCRLSAEDRRRAVVAARDSISEERTGRFRVVCTVLDGSHILGKGMLGFQVLFKGRFSDLGLPAVPPA